MSKSGQVPEGDVRLTLNVRRELRDILRAGIRTVK